jgi:hypothetical protein
MNNRINKEPFKHKYENQSKVDFVRFKSIIKTYYKPYGLTIITIEKENLYMLKNEKGNSYINLTLMNNNINLEIYDAPDFEHNHTINEVSRLIEQLDNLLNLKNDEGIVISLQGSWGIGKTFFWKYYITNKFEETKFVNISLFGINSLLEIKKKIVLKIYDSNKISSFLDNNPIIGKFMESKFGIDVSLIANNFKKDDFKNIIICFDDFERISSNLSLSEILGFISELKEQYNCKIVLINNDNMLKKQDELNHKKHLRKNKDGVLVERYFTTQTNNQEIFDRYTEKIVDVTLKYEPHLSDTILLLKEKINQEYVDWELFEKLFNTLTDNNKKLNVRLMKQLLSKLELLKEILFSDVSIKIKNVILFKLFERIIDEKVELSYLDIEIRMSDTLVKMLDKVIEKHTIDLLSAKEEINRLNEMIIKENEESKLSKNIKEKYFKYMYDLKYESTDFVNEFYELLNTEKIDIIRLLSLSTFEFYITEFLIKLDESNKPKYDKLFIQKTKLYISENLNNLENLDMFARSDISKILENYTELEIYYNSLKSVSTIDEINLKQSVKEILKKLLLERNGWNKSDEKLLSSINNELHEKWLIEDKEYFELIFKFMEWIKSFSGEKPFNEMYNNVLFLYVELSNNPKYSHKMKFILNRFTLTSNVIYKMFMKKTREEKEKLLRNTAEKWANENSKEYDESSFTPINELRNGFSYYLLNENKDNTYEKIENAMIDYFSNPKSSGVNFFKNKN